MLIDDVSDQIALAANPAELDEAVKGMWGHHFAGALTEDEAEVLDEAARARREAIQERRTETRPPRCSARSLRTSCPSTTRRSLAMSAESVFVGMPRL